jgi:hypothetical protein
MISQSLARHYEDLLREGSGWLSEGLAWTVVVPAAGPLSVAEVATRLADGGDTQSPNWMWRRPARPTRFCWGRWGTGP